VLFSCFRGSARNDLDPQHCPFTHIKTGPPCLFHAFVDPYLAALSWHSFHQSSVIAVLFCVSFSGRTFLAVLFCLLVLFWLSRYCCRVMAVLFWQSCSDSPVLDVILSWLSEVGIANFFVESANHSSANLFGVR
jgi:hypothetical protein